MADKKTRRLTPADLQADLDSYAGLEGLGDYDPKNPDYKPANGAAFKSQMQTKQTKEVQDYGIYQASRDSAVTAEWNFHDFMRNARTQVKAQ